MNGYITQAEALPAQDALGNAGVRFNFLDSGGGWSYQMIDPEAAVKVGEQLIRMGQNALTTNRLITDGSYLDVMRERRRQQCLDDLAYELGEMKYARAGDDTKEWVR